jgi:dihydroorotate dehydrogenase
MGLTFNNPLGLAAGVDRTGALLPALRAYGFGHIEIGTITPETGHALPRRPPVSRVPIGANIASSRHGLDAQVIEDYDSLLRSVLPHCDYVVANLSAPGLGRNGNTPGVDVLARRLSVVRDVLSAVGGRHVPVLLKLEAGPSSASFPAAIMAARSSGLDGVVLVSDCTRRLGQICAYLDGLAVVSVGGVTSAEDVKVRLAAGAALVQVHRTFATGGAKRVRRILDGISRPECRA